jgi:hypothetical protein
MQTANKTQGRQSASPIAQHEKQSAQRATGPMPIPPELLQFISGGKAVEAAPATLSAPGRNW